jgi:hypothetical protein
MKKIRLGGATAWSRDRFEPASDLVSRGNVDYLCFDSMSEVTMSAAQVQRMEDDRIVPYDPYLVPRMEPILSACKEKGIRIITNQGWLDPVAAAERVQQLAQEQGVRNLKVAAVVGGVLSDAIADMGLVFLEDGKPVSDSRPQIVSGEVYQGAGGIVEALKMGADVVITSRVGDACVYLGPIAFEFGWDLDDHHKAAKGMIIGHLVECGAQVSGGYFCDPGYKDVPNLHDVGNPIVEITEDGRVVIGKLPDSGGLVSTATCKEQLLYEVQDPANYYCPDVIADLTKVTFKQVGENLVEVFANAAGKPKTPTLKALIGLTEGYMTEEMIVFAGPGALDRAEATKQILLERFKKCRLDVDEIRWDFVGHNSIHRESSPSWKSEPYEVVLRVAIKTKTRAEAEKLRKEVDPLAVNGVCGTGKWGTTAPGSRVRVVVGLNSALVPREKVPYKVIMKEAT